MSAPLYQIHADIARLIDEYNSAESDEDLQRIETELNSLNMNLEEKVVNIGYVILNLQADNRELDGQIAKFAVEVDRLKTTKAVRDNRIKRLKDDLLAAMETARLPKVKTADISVTVAKNGQPSVNVTDASKVPDKYKIIQDPLVDKKAIARDWQETHEAPDGAEVTQGKHLLIR